MRITLQQLEKLIKEEARAFLKEQGRYRKGAWEDRGWDIVRNIYDRDPAKGMKDKAPRKTDRMMRRRVSKPGPMRTPTKAERLINHARKIAPGPFKNLSKHFSEKLSFGQRFNIVLAALLLTGDSEPPMETAVQQAAPYIQPDPANLMNPEQILQQAEAAYKDYKQKLADLKNEPAMYARD